ncbi:gamma-aminobutyric acid receptor subunit alpha-6-like [Schistocerca serialis cubense]|uniref:gamma-aminobutyric acid receptor subunit alpha-6-like n=1 Tax=Schistocerca serialis cubense TaxID=2023355 RepID=UPI00214EA79A|nr:gamma-aminobutyric acid receptor subunit alpha-6-like [Schistocerca serialis cubense]
MRWWLVVALVAWCAAPACRAQASFRDYRALSSNFTRLLDTLLDKERYDKRLRPDLGGPPLSVTVNILIKTMSEVSEGDQHYTLDCYFRQTWTDRRLTFDFPGLDEFSLSWLFLDRVWKPDTFFLNGKKSHLHRISVPNKFLRLRHDGLLTYSIRLTIQARCPMHLRKFPLDSQACPLVIGSYGYRSSDLVYRWLGGSSSVVAEGVELAQYDLVRVTTKENISVFFGDDEYSVLRCVFSMKRRTGYYMLQVFLPCGLIVCCSWVAFWIDPDDVPGRVAMGVMTVLSMANMGFGGRAQMPRVSYATALDYFVILCFSFVFAVVIEYAAINFIDKTQLDATRSQKMKKPKSTAAPEGPPAVPALVVELANEGTQKGESAGEDSGLETDELPARTQRSASLTHAPRDSSVDAPGGSLKAPSAAGLRRRSEAALLSVPGLAPVRRRSVAAMASLRGSIMDLRRAASSLRREKGDKFSRIDMAARKAFPVAFTSLLGLYWLLYMYYVTDELPLKAAASLLMGAPVPAN